MPGQNVVCLISGGKDSLFSILHCLHNGHDVIALANLHPPLGGQEDAEEDLDSFMYQTIGHKIIPLYEQALGLPLYRQEIAGSALNQSKSYGQVSEDDDETESLVPLLRRVKEHHPDVNAVSSGAILSDYQRTRVESVAIRLGLTPLSYLWQWPNLPPHTQSTLLEDMNAAGQDSRIIKVASGGLDSSFLWSNVADLRTMSRIDKAVKRFGSEDDGAVLGEGGEYETLAIAGPAPLWKRKIEVAEEEREVVMGEAGSASLRITGARVSMEPTTSEHASVRVPSLLEPKLTLLLEQLYDGDVAVPESPTAVANDHSHGMPDHVCYQRLMGPAHAPVTEQMASIMNKDALSTILQHQNPPLAFSNIAYVSIILRRMSDFAAINAIYTKAFTETNPPARITLAEPSALPEGNDVMISFTCVRGPAGGRQGLHVQSQSYWAPANIGPYSQAISVPVNLEAVGSNIVYIAGQIPLTPASMELASSEARDGNIQAFAEQSVLAAQHFVRIGRAMRVKQWICGIAFVTAVSEGDAASKADIARRTWRGITNPMSGDQHKTEEDLEEDFDVWDVKHGAQRSYKSAGMPHEEISSPATAASTPQPKVIQVEALPRGASIEWAVYGLTGNGQTTPVIPHFRHILEVFKDRIMR